LLQTIVSKELDKLGAMLEQLEPNERINAISKLLPYILPRQTEVTAESIKRQPEKVEVIFTDFSDNSN
jgi:hypothetical protein